MTWLWLIPSFAAGWLAHTAFIKRAFRVTLAADTPKAKRVRAQLRRALGPDEGVPGDVFDAFERAWVEARRNGCTYCVEPMGNGFASALGQVEPPGSKAPTARGEYRTPGIPEDVVDLVLRGWNPR